MRRFHRCRLLIPLFLLCLVLPGAAAQTPAIFWASDPVRPDEVVMAQGSFPAQCTVRVGQYGNAPPGLPPAPGQTRPPATRPAEVLQASAECLKFLLPAGGKPGLYFCEVVGPEGQATVVLNAPSPWWMQGDAGTEASPGGWLRIFGKCLSLGDGPQVCLVSRAGRKSLVPAKGKDGWELAVSLPADTVPGEYQVFVHNGCGGPDGWRSAGTVLIARHEPPWRDDLFPVSDFGALPNDPEDDTAGIQAALDAAERNGGGIVTFSRGRYTLTATLRIPRRVLLKGAGRELTELHWLDSPQPVTLMTGTNSFGVEDLALTAINHLHGIVADQAQEGAGEVFIRRVRMRLNRYMYQRTAEEVDRRFRQPLGDAIRIGGKNLQILDCDIYVTGRALYLSRTRGGLVAGNTFYNGPWGWYCLSGSDGLVFENNQILGADTMSTGGGINCLDGSAYSQNVYFAHNRLALMFGWDREAMTSDAGGGAYFGKITACEGTRLTLAEEVKWGGRNWAGAGVFILGGKGAGQYRRIVKWQDREVEVDEPWQVPPDENSVLSITMLQRHYLLVDNEVEDAGMVQFYGISIEHMVARNRSRRGGGFANFGHRYVGGWQPSWYVQYFDNEILEGLAFGGANSPYPPPVTHFAVYADRLPEFAGPLARCTVMRRNRVASNGRFEAWGGVQDVLMENGFVAESDVGIKISEGVTGVLLRGNRFEKVKEPYTGTGIGQALLHPAERLGANLEAAEGVRGSGTTSPDWGAVRERLERLARRPISDPALAEEMQQAYEEAVRAASSPGIAWGPDFLRVLLGLEVQVKASPDLERVLVSSPGGEAPLVVQARLGPQALPATLEFSAAPDQPGGSLPLEPGATSEGTCAYRVPAYAWSQQRGRLEYTLRGENWALRGAQDFRVGSGAIREWLVIGPFANPGKQALDETIHPPEVRLAASGEYEAVGGKVRWQPLVADNVDFGAALGAQEYAVGYALACLRAQRPLRVTIAVTSDDGCRAYLNDRTLLINRKTGIGRTTAQLEQGDNLLLCAVTQTKGAWRLRVEVSPQEPTAPGELAAVPASELPQLPRLNPPPPAAVAQGTGLPFSGDLDWQLIFSDDFERGAVGNLWRTVSGTWTLERGWLTAGGVGLIVYDRPIRAPWRMEYDVSSPGPTDMACVWMRDEEGWAGGYFFGFGSDGNIRNKLLKNGEYVATSERPLPEPNRPYHVIAQVLPRRVQMIVNGQMALDYADPAPVQDADSLGFYPWGEAQFDNVRIYTARL